MAGCAVDAIEVPDGLGGIREVVCQEAAAIIAVEDAAEAPLVPGQGPKIQDLHSEDVPWLSWHALLIRASDGSAQVVHL